MIQDIRQAFRALVARPGITVVAMITLAIGVGANTALFSVVDAVLLRPLSIPDEDQLVIPFAMLGGDDAFFVSAVDYFEWRDHARSFESVSVGRPQAVSLLGEGEPERLKAATVDGLFASTMGVRPVLGRAINEEDVREGASVVVLAYGLWQRRFGGSESVIGERLVIEGRGHTVIGVLEADFDLPFEAELWTPFDIHSLPTARLGSKILYSVARLRDGATVEDARMELGAIAERIAEERPDTHRGWGMAVVPIRQALLQDLKGRVRTGLLALFGAVGVLLLIASANVGNLLLARSLGRTHELAVRLALGANRSRLTRLLLSESLMISAAGGLLSLPILHWLTPLVLALSPIQSTGMSNQLFDVGINMRAAFFGLGVVSLAGALSGLVPAFRASRPDVAQLLSQGKRTSSLGRGTRRLLHTSVVGQVALTVILLTGAAAMVESLYHLQELDVGFRSEGLIEAEVNLSTFEYSEPGRRRAFVDQLLEDLRNRPGVADVGVSTNVPFSLPSWNAEFECEGLEDATGDQADAFLTSDRLVSPGYLETLGVRLLDGRLIAATDTALAPRVVVVSEDLVRPCWPDINVVGKRIRRVSQVLPTDWMTIIGVVDSVKEERVTFRRDRAVWYVPYTQVDVHRSVHVVIRPEGDRQQLGRTIQDAVWEIDAGQPVSLTTLMELRFAALTATERLSAILMIFFAATALVLSGVGIYGTVANGVRSRFTEIGTRLALGATSRNIIVLIVGNSVVLSLTGVLLGLLAWAFLSPLLSGFLYGVASNPSQRFVLIGGGLVLLAAVACVVPTRRALSIDPVAAIRDSH